MPVLVSLSGGPWSSAVHSLHTPIWDRCSCPRPEAPGNQGSGLLLSGSLESLARDLGSLADSLEALVDVNAGYLPPGRKLH